ncbi:MAG: hypothetical protein PW788_02970 [Micavibrio sp.]|nr:hypothetical protein [Micavibrio sp.]
MANENSPEKPSKLKLAFQWAGAFASALTAEAPQAGFQQAGDAYDYVKTWAGSKSKPVTPTKCACG